MHIQRLLSEAQAQIREVEPAVVASRLPGYLVVDVREPQEVLQGYLPGAINVPRGLLEFRIERDSRFTDRDRCILIYSNKGGRSTLAVQTMLKLGFSNVQSLAGGYQRWSEQGRPID